MPDQINDLIKKVSKGANTILLLGDLDHVDSFTPDQKIISISEKTLSTLPDYGLFDLVLIKGLLESLSYEKAEHIIAQTRDSHAREMLLIVSKSIEWKDTDLLGLNLRKVAELDQQNEILQAWYFARDSYKKIPDWLNSRYWANPEMFEKYRW